MKINLKLNPMKDKSSSIVGVIYSYKILSENISNKKKAGWLIS